jgi:hypothetical protein
MWSGRWNENLAGEITRRIPAPVSLCPPQIPHDLTWVRNRAAAVGIHMIYSVLVVTPAVKGRFYRVRRIGGAFRGHTLQDIMACDIIVQFG